MKYSVIAAVSAALLLSCSGGGVKTQDKEEAAHVHTEGCSHDHSHEAHDHEAHDHEAHDHSHDGHDHAPGEACGNDHEEHSHAPGEACDHDHAEHDHSGHDHSAHSHDHSGHDHGEEASDPDEIVFSQAQAARTDFEVTEIQPSAFHEVIKTGGRIMPAQGDEVSVVAPAAGIVAFGTAKITEGTAVSRGQNLFYISTRNIASGDLLTRNRAAYEKARNDYERAGKLLEDRIVSQREYDEARLTYEQARAEYSALSGSSGRGISVSSGIGGYVGSLAVSEGDYVETGALLATVTQNRTLVLRAEVSQKYLPNLRTVAGANFTDPYNDTTYKLSDMDGRLLSVGRSQAVGNALVPVTFQFRNTGAVIPGTYVEVALLGAQEENVLAVPLTAVTEQQGLYYVYVQIDAECYRRQEVRLGADDGERVRILSGISPGDRVVTRGAVNVRMASASGSIPHTHEH